MMPETISPTDAKTLIAQGALLVDVREADEHARSNIPGARLIPLSEIAGGTPDLGDAQTVVFHCRSGGRTMAASDHLTGRDGVKTYIMDGGLEAWRKAGLPVTVNKNQPIEVMRQVQIAAGGLVLAGVVGGATVHPAFYGLAGFVGAGLAFAGVTGFCGMARLLQQMPWNRRPQASAQAAQGA
ncbi:MAG: rhodanese family protein [Pseudomonadota bacterium]